MIAAAAAVAANGSSARYGYNMADMTAVASTGNGRYIYNAAAAAAAHRESSSAYFSSASFNPAAYAAFAQMSSWNNYSIAAYQGLQREGVTYGRNEKH
jgi:hypothetical protein